MDRLKQIAGRNVLPIINKSDFGKLKVSLPPLAEQVAIARILDALDMAIERTREAVDRALVLQTSLLTDAFERMQGERKRLGEFTTDVRYGTSQAANERGWGSPTLRIPNVVGDQRTLDDLVYVDLKPTDIKRLMLRDGDLLLVRTNGNPHYVGRSAVFKAPDDRPWIYASYLIRVRLTDELLPDYVNIFLGMERGRRELLRRVTTSAGNHNINSNSLVSLRGDVGASPSRSPRT
jgi:type I restriction enzyme S subunit